MTKVESGPKADTKSVKSEKERSGRRAHKKEKQKPQTKIIMRHLPPTMTEEEFLKQIDPLPLHDFYYYATADWSLGYDATCRAYITMKNYDDVFLFRDRFDGYVFVDSKGAEYPAIVEFAPFQGLLKNKSRRSDNKVNTIEQESHYQQFLAKLEEEREAAAKGGECKLEFSLDRKKEEKITSTPLLQYLANKKEKRREEAKRRQEEKRRQREEEKEKRKQGQQQVTKIISNQESGGCGGKGAGKSAGGKENIAGDRGNQQHEEGKNSRSQRRAERNQRRREEYERRRQEREQREKIGSKVDDEGENNITITSEGKTAEPQTVKPDESKQLQRKEGKRYSERRERERNRNRKDKEKEKEKEKDKQKDSAIDTKSDATTSETITAAAVAVSGGETAVSESVMNFIRSVATAKEFVPKHKQQKLEEQQKKLTDESKDPLDQEKCGDKISVTDKKKFESEGIDDTRSHRQRISDEQRRIRNKDRPSIAIYQPKARLRMSEERDATTQQQTSGKGDARSNPTSDCESVKKEEIRTKKISRYSERRAERRNNRDKNVVEGKEMLDKTDQHKSTEDESVIPVEPDQTNSNDN